MGADIIHRRPLVDSDSDSSTFSSSQSHSKKDMYIVLFVVLLDGIAFGVTMPSIYQYVRQLGGSKFQYGIIVSSFSAGTFIGGPLLGIWYNRRSLKESLSGAMFICTFCSITYAISWNVWVVLFSRLLLGVGSGSLAIVRAYLSTVTTSAERTLANAYVNALQILGIVLGPVVGLVFSFIDIRIVGKLHINEYTSPGWLCALLFLVSVFLLRCYFIETRPRTKEAAESFQKFSGLSRALVICLVLNYILSTVNAVIQAVASPFVMSAYGWNVAQTGLMFAFGAVACILGYVLLQKFTKMYRRLPSDETIAKLKPELFKDNTEVPEDSSRMPSVMTSLSRDFKRIPQKFERIDSVSEKVFDSLKNNVMENDASFYDRIVMIVGLIVVLIGFLCFSFVYSINSHYVPKSIFFFTLTTVSLFYPGTQTLLISVYSQLLPPSKQGTAQGMLMSVQSMSLLITPLWSSFVFEKYGAGVVFLLESLHFLIGIILTVKYFSLLKVKQTEIDVDL
ncbi:hypothetical protein P9112_008823 [Eukaryota sp. TZLM1-RC]